MVYSYVVQKGDTLFRIARRYNIHTDSIYSVNPQLKGQRYIYPGQVIQLQLPEVPKYVIQAGDTFYDIAHRFRISLTDLLAANPGVNPRRLLIGQIIVLPLSKGMDIVDTTNDYGYVELLEDIGLLGQRYPFLQADSIGNSVLGKPIPVIRIGTGPKQVHYNGSFHANEWITTLLLMKFLEDYANAFTGSGLLRGKNMKVLYEETSLWVVPMVNPDGVELVQEGAMPTHPYYMQLLEWNFGSRDFSGWKANIRGVDLNDQFPANWELERDRREVAGPGPRDYTGETPLSEPEAKAIADFTQAHDFRLVIAFHTQGQEIYWNYRDLEPPESETIANRLAQVSRYRAIKLPESDAGYKDWFIQQYRRPGFTVEAGIGTNPLPISQFRSIYDDVIGLLIEGLIV
ncbi:M14 family metallopeptidase [Paenibacillus rigui]|uniref:Peptidase M14 n=1 Tax=Paenibacillus rigui TaxID=554312 RepID=A0A229UL92_9BACL|nr:M14 family metallopeptidase [Paenibacillus rigui]OXM84176.1 peptidase M14 [Paenibacillus rigui]